MPSFSFGCAARVAAKRGRTAAQPHSRTAARPHCRTASRPHGPTAARLHGGTAARRTTEWRHRTAERVGGGSPYTRLRFPPPTELGQPARSARRAACVHPLLDRIGDRCFSCPSFGGPCAERCGEGADGAASTVRADRGATGSRCSDGSGLTGTTAERIARCARAVAER